MRRPAIALFLMLAFIGTSAAASPSAHSTECSDFTTQAEAQEAFDNHAYDDTNFDADGNGIACDQPGDYGQGGPSAFPSTCADFASQAEAQNYFDTQGKNYLNLDADGNGIACDQPGDYGQTGPSAHPSECGDFTTRADAQTYFDNELDDYLNLDADGNGVACDEDSAFVVTESDSSNTTDVQKLPVAGSGLTIPASSTTVAILLGMCVTVGAAAFKGIGQTRR